MQTLRIELPTPHLIADSQLLVVLVGCGGTGSHIAQSLARIAAHVRAGGMPALNLVFVDGDLVEQKNVGRQLFSPAEIGRNKAQTLAARFNAALGLQIQAVPKMADAELLSEISYSARYGTGVLVGAVDGADGRRTLAAALETPRYAYWLDCGNHESSGQVVIGGAPLAKVRHAFDLPGVCAALPAPHVVYPDLLKAAPRRKRDDCAALQEDNVQSLMVNQMMAAVAGEYLYNLIVRRRLETFATTVDLASLSMRSHPITRAAIAEACGAARPDKFFAEQQTFTRKKAA